ncbi:MAG: hypothetical protein A2745_00085 [Candidatus Harrisonbacteria bacterium RIFCSPHIGHO2_01_FULL_44_13]|nr:MAG: hypothetical protein A2745_00085 [Candidatus Harrisonbacteria bacterium RIFCSPHIGHO2_01_FULL_44_13]
MILKSKRDLTFLLLAVLLFLIVAGYTIYAISFLVSKANAVLGAAAVKPPEIVSFNIEKAEALRSAKLGR